jgi:hypothetical protein
MTIDYTSESNICSEPIICADGLPFKETPRHLRRTTKPIVDPTRCVIFTPDRNEKRADFTGAFKPEADAFAELHGISKDQIHRVNISEPMSKRAAHVLSVIAATKPQVVVFFCHGYANGIQLGFQSPTYRRATKDTKRDFNALLDLLATTPNVSVILYCCSTGDDPDGDEDSAPGSGDDSFADLIRDGLCARGAVSNRVFAHTTAGHTTRNPNIKFYEGMGSPLGGVGASLVARVGTPAFRKLAAGLKTDLRFRIGFMSVGRVHELI